jgi:uncharacterized protein YjdB
VSGKVTVGVSSSKKSVAQVKGGKQVSARVGKALTVSIKARKTGVTTIRLTGPGGAKLAFKVRVVAKPVKATKVAVKLGKDKAGAKVLRVVTTPRSATWQPLTWSTSNRTVMTVDAAGRITVRAPGQAKITAKYGAKKTRITIGSGQ